MSDDPAVPSSMAKTFHIMFLSTFWGMQLWVTFISGPVLSCYLTRHAHGFVQSRLLPYYFHIGSACAFFNLSIFTMYHPRESLNEHETKQIIIYFINVTVAALNAQLFGQRTSEILSEMHHIERSRGLGQEVGPLPNKAYANLRESDAKYRKLSSQLSFHHNISSICNMCCIICNGLNVYYLSDNLSTL